MTKKDETDRNVSVGIQSIATMIDECIYTVQHKLRTSLREAEFIPYLVEIQEQKNLLLLSIEEMYDECEKYKKMYLEQVKLRADDGIRSIDEEDRLKDEIANHRREIKQLRTKLAEPTAIRWLRRLRVLS